MPLGKHFQALDSVKFNDLRSTGIGSLDVPMATFLYLLCSINLSMPLFGENEYNYTFKLWSVMSTLVPSNHCRDCTTVTVSRAKCEVVIQE